MVPAKIPFPKPRVTTVAIMRACPRPRRRSQTPGQAPLHRRGALRIDIFIGVWAFLLAYIWTRHIEPRQGGDRLQAVEIWERLKAAAAVSCQSVPARRTRSELSNRNISSAHAGCAVSTPLRFSPASQECAGLGNAGFAGWTDSLAVTSAARPSSA